MSANVDRKAYFFSGASGFLLISFAVLYQLGLSPLPTIISYVILGVLVVATIVPIISRGWCEDSHTENSFAQFADLGFPPQQEFSFAVESLPAYRKIHAAPARLASALAGLMILLAFGGQVIIGKMLESSIPFTVFTLIASGFVLVSLALIVLFVVSTAKELRLREAFHGEVLAGFAASGYKPVRTFHAENISDRRVLVSDGKDHYSWWDLSFDGGTAEAKWSDTLHLKTSSGNNKNDPTEVTSVTP